MEELERMKKVALNNKMKEEKDMVSSSNIYSLKKHFGDMKASSKIIKSEVICLQETWIEPEQGTTNYLQIDGFNAHFASVGRGKGIATYFREGFTVEKVILKPTYQMTKITSEYKEIINVYRSANAPNNFLDDLLSLINEEKITYIIGDFNICYKSEKNHGVVKSLEDMRFR